MYNIFTKDMNSKTIFNFEIEFNVVDKYSKVFYLI